MGGRKIEDGYLAGFGNHHVTEALSGALPEGQNSPQKVPYGLYAEQISGSAFTALRHENLRSWLYRIRPSVVQGAFQRIDNGHIFSGPLHHGSPSPNQMRWDPIPVPKTPTHFLQGLTTLVANGDFRNQTGVAVHLYGANRSMQEEFFYCADGEFLFVPQTGALLLRTEFGEIGVSPGEIAVIPRGVKFQVRLSENEARGYVCENYGQPFRLPGLGPIGSNGLANPRDFLAPRAKYEDTEGKFRLVSKFQGQLWEAELTHSPLNVVAWHGNYSPYKYSLDRFQSVNSVSFDHSDPSIFTVLTSPSTQEGVANCDFVIFPPRWVVAEHTFRPPWFHRNFMSEYMGLIHGVYDAKAEGFLPGGGSLHNCMSPHGPDAETFSRASTAKLEPCYQGDTLAFMFESCYPYQTTVFAETTEALQKDYQSCWQGLKKNFNPTRP